MSETIKTRVFVGVTLVLLAALGGAVYLWQQTAQQVQFFTDSNKSLRSILGDMTKTITAKDREIDRLSSLDCNAGTNPPQVGARPVRRTATR